MKIGIVIDRLNVGGVEKIALEQVIALRKLGEDAHLVVLREKAVVPNAFPDLIKDVPVIYLDSRIPKLLRFSFGFPVFSFFSLFHLTYPLLLPFVVKKNEFDYFIVHGTYTSLTAVSLKKFRSIRFSAFIWDPVSYILDRVYATKFLAPILWVLKKIAYRLDKFLIKNMDNVLVGGPAHNQFIHKIDPQKSIEVVYPSVHPIKEPVPKKDYVLMVTAWKEGKNPEYILKVAEKLPNVRIKLVGKWLDPAFRQQFENKLEKSSASSQIEIVGSVSEAELAVLYAEARVLLQTNDDRGFGMPALEAAGSATTFIIPEGQGVGELFTNGEGFYTKEKDTTTIVKYLKKLMENKTLATQLGRKAWQKVEGNYSWKKHAEELKGIIKKTITGGELR